MIRTPFFAVSQAQNVGLQLADVVTTVCGMRFAGQREIDPLFRLLGKCLSRYRLGTRRFTSLVIFSAQQKKRFGGIAARG